MKKTYLESAYITVMGTLCILLVTAVYIYLSPKFGSIDVSILMWSLYVLLIISFFLVPEYYAFITISSVGVTSIRPFRHIRTIKYADIYDIVIDYAVISGGQRLYYIVISRCKIPASCIHRMNRIPWKMRREIITFSYDKKRFQDMLEIFPSREKSMLLKCQSTIRLYHLDQE